MKLKIFLIITILLIGNFCSASEPTLKDTLDWLQIKIPQYTQENRSNIFNYLFEDNLDNYDSNYVSYWELSYDMNNLCNLVLTLKNMRRYKFNLSNVIRIHTKQRGEYIKLVIEMEKDRVIFEEIQNSDNPEIIKKQSRKNIIVIDFPIYAKDMALNITKAFKYAVFLCKDKE